MSINSTSFSDEASTVITPILPHLLQIKPKRKRSLPGNPDPDAEVIALSPTTLMTTSRFVCEVCNKGFQRDQNLQLHRRGHNLPWKLKRRNNKEVMRKKVYVCPEASCVHHHPSRALGDLTGIKKHFCRKHGEKSFHCEKCSKRYAVHSDWKAHVKTCGTREYRCDCGTLFPRKDSFMTHRAFCKALAEESARVIASASTVSFSGNGLPSPPTPTPIEPLSWAPSSLTSSSTTTTAHDQMMVPPQYLLYLPPAPPSLLPAPPVSATALLQKAAAAAWPLAGLAGSFHGLDMEWGGDVLRARGARAILQEDVKEITTTRDFLGETAGRPTSTWLPAFPSALAGGGGGGGGGAGPERLGLSWEGMGSMIKQPIAAFGNAQCYNAAWSDY